MKCPFGKTIGVWKHAVGSLPPGDCTVCKEGPLHGAFKGAGGCRCSFVRDNELLCRSCAILWDILYQGSSKIGHDYDEQLILAIAKIVEHYPLKGILHGR